MNDLEARREARRRKILANAEKRLKLITNTQNNEGVNEEPTEGNHIPEVVGEVFEEEISAEDNELSEIFQNSQNISSEANVCKLVDKRTAQVVVLIGLAVFTRMLQLLVSFVASDPDAKVVNKVFAPFFLYELMDVCVMKTEIPSNGLINFLVFFGNIRPNVSKTVIEVFNLVSKIVKDGMLFFFVYVMMDIMVGKLTE